MKETIRVTVQREDRLQAIKDLAEAIKYTAKALSSNVEVEINSCTFQSCETGVVIETQDEDMETRIERDEESEEEKEV